MGTPTGKKTSQKAGSVGGLVAGIMTKNATAFNEILLRLKLASNTKSDSALARAMGLRQSAISTAKSRGQIPPVWVVNISSNYHVSSDWLLFGTGSMKPFNDIHPVKEIWDNLNAIDYLSTNAHILHTAIEITFKCKLGLQRVNHLLKFENGAVQLVRSKLNLENPTARAEVKLIRDSFNKFNVRTVQFKMNISDIEGLSRSSPWYCIVKKYEDITSGQNIDYAQAILGLTSKTNLEQDLSTERTFSREIVAENRRLLKTNANLRVELTAIKTKIDLD